MKKRLSISFAVSLAASLLVAHVPLLQSQERPDTSDTYRDSAVSSLMLRARAARARDIDGMKSYEGLLRERMYVGLTARGIRRERSLFEQERIARLRWSADGERAIHWIGARQAIPIVGADTRRDEINAEGKVGKAGAEVQAELRQELPEDLLDEADLPGFAFDPAGDRLSFGEDWALHPLSDTSAAYYRFASGDTLRLGLPDGRSIVLLEVKVEPRTADFHLVAGSLWFDQESASLVRATYRPARPFNLLLDEPEDAEDVPGFLQPVEAELSYITVEYSLQEFKFWLPRRFALQGEARLGRLLTIPLTVEWSIGDYEVNQDTTSIPVTGPLPPGWSRREKRVEDDDGNVSYLTVIVPETRSLLTSDELSEDFGQPTPTAFTDAEVEELRGELDALLPTYRRFTPQLEYGWSRGLVRYNRVEGLSVGAAATMPLGPNTSARLDGRIGTGDLEPNVSLSLRRGPDESYWEVSGYHRLEGIGDWSSPFSFKSTLENFLLGRGKSQFYRVTGGSLGYDWTTPRTRGSLSGFYEDHDFVVLTTEFSVLGKLRDDTVATVLAADPARIEGARGSLRWFSGVDPRGLILTGTVLGEVAVGDARYQRAAATLSASHPLPFGLAGALEVGAGAVWGDELLQRMFVLGGASTLRGFQDEAARGASFWRGRAELASGFPGARLSVFTDWGWAGPRADWGFQDPLGSVGVGFSLLDGFLRADVARAVRGRSGWGVHVYLDGLF